MDDMQAFQQRANEARAAIGKPPVFPRPSVPYRLMYRSAVGVLIMWVQDFELTRSIALAELERKIDEARQKGRR